MKLLQKILAIFVILAVVYVPASYGAEENKPTPYSKIDDDKPVTPTVTIRKRRYFPDSIRRRRINPVPKPAENDDKKADEVELIEQPLPEKTPLEKLNQMLKESPMYLTNWDFDNMIVNLCDAEDSALSRLFTVRDLEYCDFDSKALEVFNVDKSGSFTVYNLELRDVPIFGGITIKAKPSIMLEERSSQPIDGIDDAVMKKPVVCRVPRGMTWNPDSMYFSSIRGYDANTGSNVWSPYQAGTIVMCSSFENLVRALSLRKESR